MKSIKTIAESALTDRVLILAGAMLYLIIFWQIIPHGDALRVVRQIESSNLIWNPNHLIFDPIGYAVYRLLSRFLADVTPLASFEIISVIATLVSLMIFYEILLRLGVKKHDRMLVIVGLFASASFLGLAGSQYYFMVQMPFLLGALYLYIDFILKYRAGLHAGSNLYGMGVLLALAAAVMFNNLLVVIASGLAVGFVHTTWRRWEWKNTLRLYVAAAAIGFPVFIIGYYFSGTTSSLIDWLLSYSGDSVGTHNAYYGLKWTLSGVVQGAIKTGFNYILGSIVEVAGLGTVMSVIVFGQTYEFIPQWSKIVASLIVIPPTMLMTLWILYFIFRRVSAEPAVRYLALWLLAYVAFNYLWDCNDEIFWIQTIPVVWLLLLLSLGAMCEPILLGNVGIFARAPGSWRWKGITVYVALLLAVNTMNLIVPLADRNYFEKQSRHSRLLREGDLQIIPGWDQQKWFMLDKEAPNVRRLVLMNMALAGSNSAEEMRRLPEYVESQLRGGGRVIVARLFDLDEDIMPWYGLQRLGWSRNRIQDLLSPFCNRKIDQIESVVIRELYTCEDSLTDSK
jgi:hypothetical protein